MTRIVTVTFAAFVLLAGVLLAQPPKSSLNVLPDAKTALPVGVVTSLTPGKWLVFTDKLGLIAPTVLDGGKVCMFVGPAGSYAVVLITPDEQQPQVATVVLAGKPPVPPVPPNPAPTITASVVPASIVSGASATLTWKTTNAKTVMRDGQVVALSGTADVSPVATTAYTFQAIGAGGTKTAAVTLTVTAPPQPTADHLTVLIVEETADRGNEAKVSKAQMDVLTAKDQLSVVAYLVANAKDKDGSSSWRIVDKDQPLDRDLQVFRDLLAKPRASLPWLYAVGPGGSFSGAVATRDVMLQELKRVRGN